MDLTLSLGYQSRRLSIWCHKTSKQINLACKEAKEKWLVNECEEVEQLEKQYKSREMHNKVKELTSKNTKRKQVDA